MKEGWSSGLLSRGHYFKQDGKKFWCFYPPDSSPTGFARPEEYYIKYKSLCGKDDFIRPVKPSKKNRFTELVFQTTVKNPCLKCLLILAKQRGLV